MSCRTIGKSLTLLKWSLRFLISKVWDAEPIIDQSNPRKPGGKIVDSSKVWPCKVRLEDGLIVRKLCGKRR